MAAPVDMSMAARLLRWMMVPPGAPGALDLTCVKWPPMNRMPPYCAVAKT